MSCNRCTKSSSPDCAHQLTFKIDDQYLAPYIGGVPLEPINLQPLIAEAETDTMMQLDVTNKSLVYTGERAANGGTPDAIPIQSIAALMALKDLSDVEYGVAANGDLIVYNSTTKQWEAYTVPDGTIVSSIGLDSDGKPVKQLAAAPLPGSVEIPIGGAILWTPPISELPSNFKMANGQAISRTVYSGLFALTGTEYGAGNGTTTFNVINLNGRVPVGYQADDTDFDDLGKTGGAKKVTLSVAEMPSHTHQWRAGQGTANSPGNTTYARIDAGFNALGPTTSTGGNQAHENMPPYVVTNWAVRVI